MKDEVLDLACDSVQQIPDLAYCCMAGVGGPALRRPSLPGVVGQIMALQISGPNPQNT